jgi:hypothetical protein
VHPEDHLRERDNHNPAFGAKKKTGVRGAKKTEKGYIFPVDSFFFKRLSFGCRADRCWQNFCFVAWRYTFKLMISKIKENVVCEYLSQTTFSFDVFDFKTPLSETLSTGKVYPFSVFFMPLTPVFVQGQNRGYSARIQPGGLKSGPQMTAAK